MYIQVMIPVAMMLAQVATSLPSSRKLHIIPYTKLSLI